MANYLTCLFIPIAQTKSRQCGVSQTERIALPFLFPSPASVTTARHAGDVNRHLVFIENAWLARAEGARIPWGKGDEDLS